MKKMKKQNKKAVVMLHREIQTGFMGSSVRLSEWFRLYLGGADVALGTSTVLGSNAPWLNIASEYKAE